MSQGENTLADSEQEQSGELAGNAADDLADAAGVDGTESRTSRRTRPGVPSRVAGQMTSAGLMKLATTTK